MSPVILSKIVLIGLKKTKTETMSWASALRVLNPSLPFPSCFHTVLSSLVLFALSWASQSVWLNQKLRSRSSGGCESKIGVPAGPGSGESRPLGLPKATPVLCPHTAEKGLKLSCVSSSKDTNVIVRAAPL